MGKYSEAFVAFDVAKKKHAVAVAEGGRTGEVRFLGDVENSRLPIERTIKRLAEPIRPAACLLRSRADGIRALSPDSGSRPRLHGGRSGSDPETGGRADQDEPARRGHAGAAASGRRTDGRVGAGRGSRGGARSCPRPRGGGGRSSRASASSCFPSCCGTAGFIAEAAIGRWRIGAGSPGQKFEHAAQQIVFQEAHRRDRGCAPTPASAREATRSHRARVVHGAGRGSLPGDARRFVSRRCDLCGEDFGFLAAQRAAEYADPCSQAQKGALGEASRAPARVRRL